MCAAMRHCALGSDLFASQYLQNTEEMHMANRGIDKIRGFEEFPVLEVLWLQDNQVGIYLQLCSAVCSQSTQHV